MEKTTGFKRFGVATLALLFAIGFGAPSAEAGKGGGGGGGGGGTPTNYTFLSGNLSGQAYVLSADLKVTGLDLLGTSLMTLNATLSPTPLAALPASSGGTAFNEILHVTLKDPVLGLGTLIDSGTASAFITGAISKNRATVHGFAEVEGLSVLNGLVMVHAVDAMCGSWGNGDYARSEADGQIISLAVGGKNILVMDPGPNTEISVTDGVRVVVNNVLIADGTQATTGENTEIIIELDSAKLTVPLLGVLGSVVNRVLTVSGTVKVSVASCGLNVTKVTKPEPPPDADHYAFMTGGFRFANGSSMLTGGFNAGPRGSDPTPKGQFNAVRHDGSNAPGKHLHGQVSIFNYPYHKNTSCAEFGGPGVMDGISVNYTAIACDHGEPGWQAGDSLALVVKDAAGTTIYSNVADFGDANIDKGNLQLHLPK